MNTTKRHKTSLSPKMRAAIPLFLQGLTDEQIAAQLNVRRETVCGWKRRRDVVLAMQETVDKAYEDTLIDMKLGSREAAACLRAALNSHKASVRVQAAKTILLPILGGRGVAGLGQSVPHPEDEVPQMTMEEAFCRTLAAVQALVSFARLQSEPLSGGDRHELELLRQQITELLECPAEPPLIGEEVDPDTL